MRGRPGEVQRILGFGGLLRLLTFTDTDLAKYTISRIVSGHIDEKQPPLFTDGAVVAIL